MAKKINVAMIGVGGYAFEIIKRLWMLPDIYNVIAISSLPGYQCAGLAECISRKIPVYYDITEMLAALEKRAEIIFIPTSIHSHYDLAKQCIQAGYNVYVEKPPVAVIQHYDDLVDNLKTYGMAGTIGFQYLYSSIVQKIKDNICALKYGKVRRIRSLGARIRYDSYYNITEWGGKAKFQGKWVLDGSINNPLAHMLANCLYLASLKPLAMAEPVSVQAELYSVHKIEGEDTSSLRIITDNGVEIISNTTLCADNDLGVETVIECENADIIYTDYCRCRIVWKNGNVEEFADDCDQITYMLANIADSLKEKKVFRADIRNCRPFTLTVNCSYESSGGVQRINDIYITKQSYRDTTKRILNGIDEGIRAAHKQGRLFSECGFPWSVETKPFKCDGYNFFPSSEVIENQLIGRNLR